MMEIFYAQILLLLLYGFILILTMWIGWKRGLARMKSENHTATLSKVIQNAFFSALGAAVGLGAAAGLASVGANILYNMPLERAFWMPLIGFTLGFAVFFPGFIISLRARKSMEV